MIFLSTDVHSLESGKSGFSENTDLQHAWGTSFIIN